MLFLNPKYYILAILLFICSNVFAISTGDFRSVASGNWNTNTSWERYSSGAAWEASGVGENNPGLLPSSTSSVTIQASHNITIDAAASCNDITINGTLVGTAAVTLNVYGIWVNNSLFDLSAGTIEFIGGAPQTITGRSSFYNLTINNAAGVTLNSSISVGNTYTVTLGTLTSSPYNLVLPLPITNELRNIGTYFKIGDFATTVGVYGSSAQINNYSSGIISVETAATLASDGEVNNILAGAAIKLNGTLKLKGNFTNTGEADLSLGDASAKGTVEFIGTTNQNIVGSTTTLFENLNINNTFGAGLGVSLTSNQQVNTQLIFTTGNLLTSASTLIVGSAATFSGYDNSKYILVNGTGKLRRYIPAIGAYDLPIGFSTNSELSTIEFQTITGLSYIDINFTSPHAEVVPGGLQVNSTNIDEFLDYGYWTIAPDAGTPIYNLTVTSKGHSNGAGTADQYALITKIAGVWTNYATHSSATQVVNGSYITAKRSNMTNFGSYIIGKTNTSALYNQPTITNELRNEGAKVRLAANNTLYVLGASGDLNNYSGGAIYKNTTSTINTSGSITNNTGTITQVSGDITIGGSLTNTTATLTQTNGTVVIAANLTNDNSTYSQAAGTITLTGNLVNTNSATLSLDGTISLQGNWTNNATQSIANAGTPAIFSTVVFNGVINQTISGTAPTFFENLTINNASGVTLSNVDQNISTDGILSFTDGVITTASNKIIINNTITTAITGYNSVSNNTHINGNLRRFVGNAAYDFPVGDATNYELATVNVVSSTGLTYLDAYFVTSNQNPPSAFLTVNGSRISDFLDYGYWAIAPNTGATVSYDLTIREAGHTDLLPTSDKYAVLSNLGVGWVDYGTHSPATQIYDPTYVIAKRSTMTSFGYYLIGKTLDDAYTQPAITNELRNEGAFIKIPTGITVSAKGTGAEVNNYSSGTISIDGTGVLASDGNVINDGVASFIKVNGSFQLKGNWTNNGAASLVLGDASAKGTIEFLGTSTQTMAGSTVTQFEKLKINNSTGVTLSVNEQVDEQLILTSGIITTGGFKLINTNVLGGTTAVTGNSATSFINGNLEQYVTNSTSYYLPLGNSSTYELATFELSSSSGLDYIDAYFTEDHTQVPPGSLTVNGQLVTEFLDYGYWTVTPKVGGSGTYNIIVESAGHSNGGGTPDLYSVISDIGSGWVNYASHSTGTQSFNGANVIAKRSTLTSFGKYIIGKSIGDSYTQPPITNELRNEGAKFKIPFGAAVYVLGTSAAINNYSSGTISNDGTLYTDGNITNNGAASFITIDGSTKLKGNWTNDGGASLSDGDATYGTVEFNGNTAQTLGGTSITEFEFLKINNAASVTLLSNHRVDQQLILTAGLLNTGTNKIIITQVSGLVTC